MSLFLPKYNAIFLHIPKCAGQSIEKALGYKHHHRHHKVNDLPDDLENYFRFAFVRHPVRRFISACNYNLRVATATRKQLKRTNSESLSSSKKYRPHLITSNSNYDSIIGDLTNGKLKKIPFFKHQKYWHKKGSLSSSEEWKTLTQTSPFFQKFYASNPSSSAQINHQT